jgi:hypothetical protein
MSGEPDPLYVRARAALLDALDALEPQLNAVVLVGAQAIYLHTGDADLAVAEYTTDADFSVSPVLRASDLAGDVTAEAIELLPAHFGESTAEGVLMAIRAAGDHEDPATIEQSMLTLVEELKKASR